MNGNRFRDTVRKYLTWWLRDRPHEGKTVSFRYIWSMVAPVDAFVDVLLQGLVAPWPGLGTPTALPAIGRSRGVVRGRLDTDESYALKLRGWLERWRLAGTMEGIARNVQEYLGTPSRIRVVNRAGRWLTLNADGTIERHTQAWDWDSVSNPERAGFWSEIWIIIYDPPYANRPGTLGDVIEDDGLCLGHLCPLGERDILLGLFRTTKSAHTKTRTVIWTDDDTLFDPEDPGSLPDGTWGEWFTGGEGARVPSNRDPDCRYWEP